jgi:hypothetical protein
MEEGWDARSKGQGQEEMIVKLFCKLASVW